jgi:hypothetical protein
MSGYTVGEIGVWLLLAAGLGFALGWLVRELALRRRPPRPADVVPHDVPAPEQTPEPAPEQTPPAPAPEAPVRPAVPSPAPVAVGPHPGSALPLADGSAPSDEYVVKVSRSSKIYHAPSSPAYARTTAAIWFTGPEAAEAAGFRPPKNG